MTHRSKGEQNPHPPPKEHNDSLCTIWRAPWPGRKLRLLHLNA